MKRIAIIASLLALAAGTIWFLTGGPERVARHRIESALVERGLPQPMAECMASRLAKRLSIAQLRKLASLQPEGGEAETPLTVAGVLEKARRLGDAEIVEVTATSAAICAFDGL